MQGSPRCSTTNLWAMRGLSLYNNKNFIQVLNSSSLRHKCFTNWDTPYEIKVCRLQTRDQRNERSGEWGEQENPKISSPHPPTPISQQRASSNAKWIMVHAFLSASLQDNLWNSEWKTIKAFTHAPIIACKQALCYSGLNSGWFSTDQKYIHFTMKI